jgi:cell division protein FtsN
MIRLVIFVFIRFFITVLVIYFVLTLLKGIIQIFKIPVRRTSDSPHSVVPPKPKENYKDVQDAKFVEIPNQTKENNSDQEL